MLNEKCGESWQSLLSDDQETEAKAYTAKDKYKTIDQRGNSASRRKLDYPEFSIHLGYPINDEISDDVLQQVYDTAIDDLNKENIADKVAEFRDFVTEQQSKNTREKTKYVDLTVWQRFCLTKSEQRELENIPWDELNLLLCSFFKTVAKKNGDQYEPGTLTSFQRSIQRYLNTQGSKANILKGDEFKLSREVLGSKRKELVVKYGKGNRPQASRQVLDEEEDKLFATGELGDSNPQVLQRTVWRLLSLHFGFRARDESRRLLWGDVSLENDPETGNEVLVWKAERGSKTRQGQDHPSGHRAFYPTAQATGNERCPVKHYKTFMSHRPVEMNQPESLFYLAIHHQRKPEDIIWYKKCPLGKNEIGKLLSMAIKNAGIKGRITNHSVRKTSISRLLDVDVPENYVAQLSGHRNLKSLDAYKSASVNHQRRMSFALSRSTKTSTSQAQVSQPVKRFKSSNKQFKFS
ncbi:hypothetical protein QZH41_012445 [Actinostola sp. cb2023]|nr:hypothetical protein QZH41_012445 [Actinostola sp. cb2023]